MLKRLLAALDAIVSRGTADEREVASIVERAWMDNVEFPRHWGHALPWVRDEFQRTVGSYVRRYHRHHRCFPTGDHDVTGKKRGFIYFSPRALAFRPRTASSIVR